MNATNDIPENEQPMHFRIHFDKEGIVARALAGAGFGSFRDNGNIFITRSNFACAVFENALCERDGNSVRRFVSEIPNALPVS